MKRGLLVLFLVLLGCDADKDRDKEEPNNPPSKPGIRYEPSKPTG